MVDEISHRHHARLPFLQSKQKKKKKIKICLKEEPHKDVKESVTYVCGLLILPKGSGGNHSKGPFKLIQRITCLQVVPEEVFIFLFFFFFFFFERTNAHTHTHTHTQRDR